MKLKDKAVILAVCKKLGLECRTDVDVRQFSTTEHGIEVKLPGWRYPACIKEDGSITYDNYNGAWGAQEEMNKFTAHYGLEKAKVEARRQGFEIFEGVYQEGQDAGLELTINVDD